MVIYRYVTVKNRHKFIFLPNFVQNYELNTPAIYPVNLKSLKRGWTNTTRTKPVLNSDQSLTNNSTHCTTDLKVVARSLTHSPGCIQYVSENIVFNSYIIPAIDCVETLLSIANENLYPYHEYFVCLLPHPLPHPPSPPGKRNCFIA